MNQQATPNRAPGGTGFCLSRRELLILGGVGITVLGAFAAAGPASALAPQMVMSSYPRKTIAKLSELKLKTPVTFAYPADGIDNVLFMLGEEAGGGIGPQRDIVAFNTICPHMGGIVDASTYKPAHAILGPCPLHLSTFDLTRHGMIVSGHATASLPQIVLALEDDAIVATGVMGLFFGYSRNPSGT